MIATLPASLPSLAPLTTIARHHDLLLVVVVVVILVKVLLSLIRIIRHPALLVDRPGIVEVIFLENNYDIKNYLNN